MFPIKKFWLFTSFFLLTLFYPLIINAQKSDNAQKIIEDWLAKEKKYKRYLKIATENKNNDSIAKHLLYIGILNLDNNCELSDYEKGKKYLNQALPIITADHLRAKCYQALGDYGRFTLKRNIAIKNYTAAETIFKALNDDYNVAQCIHRKADVMGGTVKWETIIEYYEEAITYYKKAGDSTRVAGCTSNIGEDYVHLNQNKKGLSQFLKAYQINRNNEKNLYLESHVLCEIGKIYKDSIHLKQRDTFFINALDHFKKISNLDGVAYSSLLLGDLYFQENKIDEAKILGHEGLKIAQKYGHKLKIIRGYDLLTRIYEKEKDYKNALINYKDYKNYNDSISKKDMLEFMSEMETKHEVEKKNTALIQTEREKNTAKSQRNLIGFFVLILAILLIILYIYQRKLKKSNTLLVIKKKEIENINLDLEETINYKNVLLKEVHHRVKNNLQIICSILEMQIDASGSLNLRNKLQTSIDRIFSMALVHEQLYTDDSKETIDAHAYFTDILDAIVSSQQKSNKQIEIHIDMDEIELNLGVALPLGMILNELITNAFKYAFKEKSKGKIEVSLQNQQHNYTLSISDNGSGIDTSKQRTNSIGLQLAKDFTTQIRGKLTCSVDNGTHYKIKFPAA
ncbi:MAG: sensor histidine kinase [Polaribacter sp.]|nr:sensor histidine kinase [Polaribacter sp.]